ncbi:hypothetical protein WICPIJ_006618 [Wickerhamomyces pijperi]|uniref:Uncharacterized protein n=1 Tax=Wickerhamomyces pijperi TaxID=599730 RepID=A0A9P8Q202_WICPI|nr:hypothetical protein WICPIJ_006618 [Wickerhamomyces pijperi]
MILSLILFSIATVILSTLVLNRFISFKTQPSVSFSLIILISLFIPISITFLLPIDILSSNGSNESNFFFLKPDIILGFWKFEYWTAFLFMWGVLPMLQEYYRSGEFGTVAKLKDAFMENVKFLLIVGAIGVVGLVYFFAKYGFTFGTFQNLLIALSHTYSLVLSLWLMAHGLVAIPRRRWNDNFNLDYQMECLYLEIPRAHEELNEALYQFKDICAIINSLQNITGIEQSVFHKEVAFLNSLIPHDLNLRNHIISAEFTSIQQLTVHGLSKLHQTYKNEKTNYESASYEFNKHKIQVLNLQDIIESKTTGTLQFRSFTPWVRNGRLLYLIYVFFIPVVNLLFALFQFSLSFIVIESELSHSTRFSIINILLLKESISPTWKFIISMVILTYMALCAMISLTRVKVFRIYHLFPKQSNPVSVVFFTMYANRLTIPLSFNFFNFLQNDKIQSQFDSFLGVMINSSMLGGFLNNVLPRLIIIPVLLAAFNVFDKIKKWISWEYLADLIESDEDDLSDSTKRDNLIKQGKQIIQRELGSSATGTAANTRINFRNSPLQSNESQLDLNIGSGFEVDQPTGMFSGVKSLWGKLTGSNNIDSLTIPVDVEDRL